MPRYEVKKGHIVIEDEELHISLFEPMARARKKRDERKDKTRLWEGFIKDGAFHGPLYTYFKNGKPSSCFWYVHGKLWGRATFFDRKGRIHHFACFYDGKKEGKEEWWYPDGTLRTRKLFKHDELVEVSHYYPQGALERHIHLSHGKKEGLDECFDPSGKVQFRLQYQKGKLVRRIVEDKMGRAALLLASTKKP
jgi:antitoxin component YwqK of YwqJK toxin-antitoxin module